MHIFVMKKYSNTNEVSYVFLITICGTEPPASPFPHPLPPQKKGGVTERTGHGVAYPPPLSHLIRLLFSSPHFPIHSPPSFGIFSLFCFLTLWRLSTPFTLWFPSLSYISFHVSFFSLLSQTPADHPTYSPPRQSTGEGGKYVTISYSGHSLWFSPQVRLRQPPRKTPPSCPFPSRAARLPFSPPFCFFS